MRRPPRREKARREKGFVRVRCPSCWETIAVPVDPSGGRKQWFSYDCEVCCRPMRITVAFPQHPGEHRTVEVEPE